jgi:hypothetical protein
MAKKIYKEYMEKEGVCGICQAFHKFEKKKLTVAKCDQCLTWMNDDDQGRAYEQEHWSE